MRKIVFILLLSCIYVFSGTFTSVLIADAPGQSLVDEIAQAYSDVKLYHATVDFSMIRKAGRWTTTQQGDFIVAFDRINELLKLDTPDTDLVIADKKLRFRFRQIIDRYVETDAPSPLTYENITSDVPFLSQWPMVDLAMLLSDSPIQAISKNTSSSATTLAPAEADPADRPRVQFESPEGTFTCSINPDSKLIEYVEVDVDTANIGLDSADSMKLVYRYTINSINEPIDPAVYSFAVSSTDTAVTSFQQLVSGGGSGGGSGEHRLTGEVAPEFELKDMSGNDFKLVDEQADVVVLDFWATWCPPCRRGLPKLQAIYDWVKEENLSVAIYAVNVGERAKDAKRYWDRQSFTIPVLMDTEGKIASDYAVEGIPQTVVISKGVVQQVYVGLVPNLEETLKQQINELLAEKSDN